MSQVTQIQLPTTGTISGLAYTQQLNQILEAIGTQNKGGTAPQNPYAGMFWLDDSASPTWVLKQYDAAGSGTWRNLVTIDTQNGTVTAAGNGNWATKNANVLAKTAAYTVADTDDGKLIAVDATTAAITVTLPAAATAGDGFMVTLRKTDASTNAVTIAAAGSDTIDGVATRSLSGRWETVTLRSNGSAWHIESDHSVTTGVFTGGYDSGEQTITAGGALTLAHGLGQAPTLVTGFLVCKTAEIGYSVGDVLLVSMQMENLAGDRGASITVDATNINVRYGSNSAVFSVLRKDTGARTSITPANWKFIVRAWA